jgi:capsular exopolysaccharide synthesis family protein
MSPNEKAILPDDRVLDSSYALRPSASLVETGNGDWPSVALPAANDAASAPQIAPYFHAIRRHWMLAAFLGTLVGAAIGVGVYWLYGSRYTADAYLKCSLNQDIVLKGANARTPTDLEFEVFKNTQMSLMTHRIILHAALDKEVKIEDESMTIGKFSIIREENDPEGWLMRKISVSFPRKDEIMKVSVTTNDAKESAAIVTAVVGAYMDEVVQTEQKKRDERVSELKTIRVGKEAEVRDALNELRRMALISGVSESENMTAKQRSMLDEVTNLRTELLRSQININQMEAELASLMAIRESHEKQLPSNVDVQVEVSNYDPMLRDLGMQLMQEKQMKDYYDNVVSKTSKSNIVRQTTGKFDRIQQQYDSRMEELKAELSNRRKAEVDRNIAKLKSQYDISKVQYDATLDEYKKAKKEAENIGVMSIDMQMKIGSSDTAKKSLAEITAELDKLYVESKTAPRVTVLQESAEPPKRESAYAIRVALSCILGCLGFCLPFVGFVVLDVQANRINGAADVSEQLGLPVIGSVPRIPASVLHGNGKAKKSHQVWQLRLTESVDGISARLLRQAETEQRRVVMVTSAVNGEGKTTLTAQLAMSLARSGRRTLLVDFDLRSPSFDEVFGVPKSPGLSEILRGECDLSSCIHVTDTENLSVLTAGVWDRFALSALANNSVASMFKELREDYEFVIVDTSPILPIADTRFVSQYVDSVVLCVFRDISQAGHIRSACEILEAFGVRSVEAVVTGVNDNLGGKRLAYYRSPDNAAV